MEQPGESRKGTGGILQHPGTAEISHPLALYPSILRGSNPKRTRRNLFSRREKPR